MAAALCVAVLAAVAFVVVRRRYNQVLSGRNSPRTSLSLQPVVLPGSSSSNQTINPSANATQRVWISEAPATAANTNVPTGYSAAHGIGTRVAAMKVR
jgi:hypothetical protein